jgi:hypothetical protein
MIDSVDPAEIFPDPYARRFNWDHWKYIIQRHEMTIGEIRKLYGARAFAIPDDMQSDLYTSMDDQRAEDTISSPQPKLAKSMEARRQKLYVYEAWFKDEREKFQPDRKSNDEEFDALQMDEDPESESFGYVLGKWVPKYPFGRCVVVCESVILEDTPNTLPHGRCPFIPAKFEPSDNPFIPGIATNVMTIANKMNDLISRKHAYAQSEIERPMTMEVGGFPDPNMWNYIPNKSNKLIAVNPGKELTRRMPVETPQFVDLMLQQYQQYLDMASGSSAIMRGNISDGAQISAEALASLQNFASSRLALSAKMFSNAKKELTYQVMWWIRRTYDMKLSFTAMQADGTKRSFDWESDKATFESDDEDQIAKVMSEESYLVQIKSGTGTPNAKGQQQAVADKLMDRNALTIEAYLDAYEYPNRQQIAQQLSQEETDDIKAASFGKEVGVNIKEFQKNELKPAGRKERI